MTSIAAPERSLEQRRAALATANRIRTKRATLKRDLKAGRTSRADLAELMLEPPAWLSTAKILTVIRAVPKVGPVKANKLLVQARVSPSKSVDGLSLRQRAELISLLDVHIDHARLERAAVARELAAAALEATA